LPHPPTHNTLGFPFLELQSVDSTNNYVRQLVQDKSMNSGTTVFAHEQLAGKGQRGKTWSSEKDANLILSVLIDPYPIPLSFQFHLSVCVSIAIHDLFSYYAGEETTIKWPNDLYWRDKKAAGILIENIISETGKWRWAIAGIGMNINQTSFPDLPNAVSLKQITGKDFDPVLLAKELCEHLNKRFHQLTAGGFETIYREYLSHLYKSGQSVKLKKDNRIFETRIKGVSPSGKLITQHGIEEEFDFGEIEWL